MSRTCCYCEECSSGNMFATIILSILLLSVLTSQFEESLIIIIVACSVGPFIWVAIINIKFLIPRRSIEEEIITNQRWRSSSTPTTTMTHRVVNNSTDHHHGHSGDLIIETVRAERERYRNNDPETETGSVLDSSTFCCKARISRMAIKALPPVKSFSTTDKDNNVGSDDDDEYCCPICMEKFKDGELIQPFGLCVHEFHSSCLYSWLHSGNTTCPVCREDLVSISIR